MRWWYADGGQQLGPCTEQDFKTLVASGKITAQTLVWSDGMGDWAPYGSLAEDGRTGGSAAPPDGAVTCSQCRRSFPVEETIEYEGFRVCAECKPKFFQRVQEGAEIPGTLVYAGFWVRFCAKFVDGLIVGVVNWVIGMVIMAAMASVTRIGAGGVIAVQGLVMLVRMSTNVLYQTFFLGKFGATPGKMAAKLRVVRPDGSKVSYGRACARSLAEILSGLILSIGYIMAAFDDEKRTLHDRICDTRVIRVG